ncbi:MAG: sigma-70 family RNA polymerase sigma factor [Anaerolineae bacterium]|nr:sigma-70 family RNA polymerase sigma factor [Anaerolineae bacterium]
MLNEEEARLIDSAQRGDSDAIAGLYQQYVQPIYRYISYRVPDTAAAEDLTAEVFLRMVEALPRYKNNGAPFEAWLYRIASARVADFYRDKSRHPQEALSDSEPARIETPEGRLQVAEEEAELRAALRQLSEEHQDILLLRFVERKSHAEVAVLLDKSVTAVKSAQHRALTRLADLLGSDGKMRHYLRGIDE